MIFFVQTQGVIQLNQIEPRARSQPIFKSVQEITNYYKIKAILK